MSRGERTRERIVRQAAPLFNRQGYAGASVSDVMAATGLEKGGIYRHFESKEQLALESFDHAVDRMAERFSAAIREHSDAPARLRAIVGVFKSVATDPPVEGGCPVLNAAVDADDGNPALRARAKAAMDRLLDMVRRTVEKGVERGELSGNVDPDAVGTVLISTIEGGVVLSRLYGDPVYADRAAEQLERWLDQYAAG